MDSSFLGWENTLGKRWIQYGAVERAPTSDELQELLRDHAEIFGWK